MLAENLHLLNRTVRVHDIHDLVVLAQTLAFIVSKTLAANLKQYVVLHFKSVSVAKA